MVRFLSYELRSERADKSTGLYGYDRFGLPVSALSSWQWEYWSAVLDVLKNRVGAEVIAARVPRCVVLFTLSHDSDYARTGPVRSREEQRRSISCCGKRYRVAMLTYWPIRWCVCLSA